MPAKKLFDVSQREVKKFIYVSYVTRESTLYFLNVTNIDTIERDGKRDKHRKRSKILLL